jgi:hypothetical protein
MLAIVLRLPTKKSNRRRAECSQSALSGFHNCGCMQAPHLEPGRCRRLPDVGALNATRFVGSKLFADSFAFDG